MRSFTSTRPGTGISTLCPTKSLRTWTRTFGHSTESLNTPFKNTRERESPSIMIRIHLLAFGMALALFAPTVQGAVDIPTITRTIEVPHEDGTVVLASSADPETPIVTWERWPGELRIEEPAEKFELYADGRLLVTYPEYRI